MHLKKEGKSLGVTLLKRRAEPKYEQEFPCGFCLF